MTWLTGTYDGQGNWMPHANQAGQEKTVEISQAEKGITVNAPVASAVEDFPLLMPSSSNESSVYIREYRVTLTTTNDDDDIEAPFDERYF